jgi:hypothetical protein
MYPVIPFYLGGDFNFYNHEGLHQPEGFFLRRWHGLLMSGLILPSSVFTERTIIYKKKLSKSERLLQ